MYAGNVPVDLTIPSTCLLLDSEIRNWVNLLMDPKRSKREIIQDLLHHAKGDEMSPADKITCIRALKLIDQGVIHDNPVDPSISPLPRRLSPTVGLDGSEQEQE